ncbi:MAG: beta-phosphoglucomutase family hydrolase [Marinilabilia sp.]
MQEIPVFQSIKGLIFDLDGTIADTMPAHFIAWRDTLQKYGITFTGELFMQLAGIPLYGTVHKINELFGKDLEPRKVGDEKESIFRKTLRHTKIVEPVVNVIHKYHGILPMSVGTGGDREIAGETLKAVGMDKYFDIVVTADDVSQPKPHPETFLKCAKLMNIAPGDCQVFEDGIPGMNAAKEAGMHLVDVTHYHEVTFEI